MRRNRGIGMDWLRIHSLSAKLAIALIVGSVLWGLTRSEVFVLIPGFVLERGAIWELFTYAFVASDPLGVIFGALVVWSIGSSLEATWGPKRLLRVVLGCTVLAAVLTVLTAIPMASVRSFPFFGAWVMGSVIWVGYGLSFGSRQTNFWGLPVTGYVFALIGLGFVLLNGVYTHDLRPLLPELFGIALVAAYLKLDTPKTWLLRFQSWRFQRQFRSRSKHLRVIGKDRNTSRDSDRYLH